MLMRKTQSDQPRRKETKADTGLFERLTIKSQETKHKRHGLVKGAKRVQKIKPLRQEKRSKL